MNQENYQDSDQEQLIQATLRLNAKLFGMAFGILSGLTLFIATNWLLIKGGDPIGPHLSMLNEFFIGYSVSFVGSLVGFGYSFVVGFAAGWFMARVYNLITSKRNP